MLNVTLYVKCALNLTNILTLTFYRYNVMLECWKTEPDERPDFQTVEEKLRKILMDRVGGVDAIRALDLKAVGKK